MPKIAVPGEKTGYKPQSLSVSRIYLTFLGVGKTNIFACFCAGLLFRYISFHLIIFLFAHLLHDVALWQSIKWLQSVESSLNCLFCEGYYFHSSPFIHNRLSVSYSNWIRLDLRRVSQGSSLVFASSFSNFDTCLLSVLDAFGFSSLTYRIVTLIRTL